MTWPQTDRSSFSDHLRRNAPHLLPAGSGGPGVPALGDELPHGTTIVALKYPGGVLIAGDRRATQGNMIASRDVQKVYITDDYTATGIAGTAAIAVEFARLYAVELEHYEKLEGVPLSFKGKVNRLATMVRGNLAAALQGFIALPLLVGYDLDDPDPIGAGRIVSFDAAGTKLGTASVNMQAGGKAWTAAGTYNFTKGWNKVVVSRWTTEGFVVIADAVRVTGDGQQQPAPSDPTVADLLALTQSCTPVAGTSKFKTDASAGSATVQLCQLAGAIWWRADADIDCDGAADAKCTVDPDYMATTSATDSNGKYINPVKVPFYVVPLPSNGFAPKD